MKFRKLIRFLSSVDYSVVDVFTGEVYAFNRSYITVILNAKYLAMKVIDFKHSADEIVIFVSAFKGNFSFPFM